MSSLSLSTPSLCLDSPITTLIKCNDIHVFLCIGEVNDITHNSNHLEEIAVNSLTDPLVSISYQLLHLIPSAFEDDPDLKHNWHWSINPSISIHEVGNLFYIFKSQVLMSLDSTLLEQVTHKDGHLLPITKCSEHFLYREESGM